MATLQVFLPPVIKHKDQECRVRAPRRARAALPGWLCQLLTHRTCRLYSSCLCWNYKSLKSHFENTIKTFFSDGDNLPSYKNLRPVLGQQGVLLPAPDLFSRARHRVGREEMRPHKRREVSFSFSFLLFFSFSKEISDGGWKSLGCV